MTQNAIEIFVGEVTGMEARVRARYVEAESNEAHEQDQIELRGSLRGPYCKLAHTLPAEFPFRVLETEQPAAAEAVVTDPCLWSVELPHLYQADVEAVRAGKVVAEYHGMIGLRRTNSKHFDEISP